jgi:hypothetical protein
MHLELKRISDEPWAKTELQYWLSNNIIWKASCEKVEDEMEFSMVDRCSEETSRPRDASTAKT